MAQDLTVNIKTTSDVPQAMDRAKSATVGFGKQVEDIQKKFSMAFKDVFLSFLGPLALLGVAMNYIGKLIDDNRKKHEDANQAAIAGTNELMSAEDKYYANKRNNEKKAKETVEEAKTTREDVTKSFLTTDPRGRTMLFEFADEQRKLGTNKIGPGFASEDKGLDDLWVRRLLDEFHNAEVGINAHHAEGGNLVGGHGLRGDRHVGSRFDMLTDEVGEI